MTRQQIYYHNIKIQYLVNQIIIACHIQNYDKAARLFRELTTTLMPVLDAVFADIGFYNQELELVNPQGISASLQDIMTAQEGKDYVLLADYLELQLVPFIQSLQEVIRTYEGIDTNPSFWEKNLSVLEQKNPELKRKLEAYHQRYEKEAAAGTWTGEHHLETTNSGSFTLAGQDEQGVYYYHSNVNPEIEAVDFAKYYYDMGQDSYLLWGLGLGYHIREMLRIDNGITMTVFESDLDVIYHCLTAADFSGMLEKTQFSLVYDPDFTQIVSALGNTENFIIHSPSLRHIKDKKIREQMEQFFIRDSGKRNASVLFESNSRENFRNYDGYVDELKAEFEGKDAVIVAAGPSLDKNVELLKEKKPGTVILAVETVFRKLLSLGIEVDYMIVTDANSRIYNHIRGLEDKQVPMLYLATAYKGFAKNYKGKKYLICQNGYDKAEETAAEKGWNLYETGGSVSTTALDVCIRLNCRSIAFIGLDLAYTNNLAHAAGTSRRAAGETEDMQKVPAVGGGMVPVSRVFMIYNHWIAERIKKEDVVMPVYDATEGGAVVPGLEIITLREFLDKR